METETGGKRMTAITMGSGRAKVSTVCPQVAMILLALLNISCSARPVHVQEASSVEGEPSKTETAPEISERSPPDAAATKNTAIGVDDFGVYDGKEIKLYTLTNQNGLTLKAINYGAIVQELHVPDKNGKLADVVLGFDNLEAYVKGSPYFGATIGRVANRIGKAAFELEGKKYKLFPNDGPNHLHGGQKGWDKVVWNVEAKETDAGPQLLFSYTSPDGEEGYPGTVQAVVIYTLTHENELKVEMRATTDKTTLVNMAHHTYWNLGGQASGTILDHELQIESDEYTPALALVPDGRVSPVKESPFDFSKPKLIGRDVKKAGGDPIGFDHNWIIRGEPDEFRPVARLKHPASGRVLDLSADKPGLQFYSGNFLDGTLSGKDGAKYPQYSGLCLETQAFPNSINVPQWRKEVILKPGEQYEHTMIHRFSFE